VSKLNNENTVPKPIYFSIELAENIQLYANSKHRKSFTAAVEFLCSNALESIAANTEIKAMYAAAIKDPEFRKQSQIKIINALRLK